MIKLLKTSEEKELARLKKEAEAQHGKIAAIEQKQHERQRKIDAIENKYASECALYVNKDRKYGISYSAVFRLLLFAHEHAIRGYSDAEVQAIMKDIGLGNFARWLNEENPPVPAPVKKEIDPLED